MKPKNKRHLITSNANSNNSTADNTADLETSLPLSAFLKVVSYLFDSNRRFAAELYSKTFSKAIKKVLLAECN